MNMAVKLPIKRPLRQAIRRGDDRDYWKRLDLQFNRSDRDFDSRITYSGASARMYFDSTGTLKVAPMNLLTYSEQFDNAAWNKYAAVSVTQNSETAPNGTTTADTLTATGADGVVSQDASVSAQTTYTWSVYLKAATPTTLTIFIFTTGFATLASTVCNVTTSWQRFTVSASSGANTTIRIAIGGGNTFSSPEAVFAWGAQLNLGSTAFDYIPTTTAAVYLPRANAYQDHNPSTLAPLGFLIEEQRTNMALSSQDMRSSGNGNPVAFWDNTNVSVALASGTAPDGTNTLNAVPCNANGAALGHAALTIAAGSTVTYTFFAKKSNCDFVRITATGTASECNCWFNIATGATGNNDAGTGNIAFSAKSIQDVGNGIYRCRLTVTTSTITAVQALIYNASANGGSSVSGNIALLWGYDPEVGAFPTSYIATTTAAATRLADSASITGAAFSSIWNQSEVTIVAQADSRSSASTNAFICQADDGTSNNTLRMFHQTDEQIVFQVRTGGVSRFASGFGTVTDGTAYKAAAAFLSGSNAAALNGGTVTSNATAWTPSAAFTRLVIGNSQATEILNGHIQTLAIYRKRFPHTTLRSLATL